MFGIWDATSLKNYFLIIIIIIVHSSAQLSECMVPMSDPGQSFYFLCSNRFVDWLQVLVEVKGLINLHEIYYESLSENHGISMHTQKIFNSPDFMILHVFTSFLTALESVRKAKV